MLPRTTRPARKPASTDLTLLIGMANPMPMLSPISSASTATLIPTTSPRTFSSGPPECPGLIDASV